MNEWINARKRWRGIGRRSWILAAAVAVSLSANACGKNYEPVEIPESAQAPGDDGAAGTGNAGAGTGGNDVVAGNGAGVTGGEGMTDAAGNAAADGDVSVESSVLETTIMTETAPSFTDVSETVYVTGDQVNLRADASTSAEIVTALSKGTSLKRTAVSDTWSRVVYQEKTCYISTQYVSTVQPETETESAKAVSTANGGEVKLNSSWKYADFSKINSGAAMLYKSEAASRKGITVCVNAGHGTKGGSSVKTQCHPDGTPKVTGGTTSAGATSAVAVSGGMQFSDGTAEAKVTLAMAKKLKDKLLAEGYDVLMIRETDDVQLDNIARTVIANNMADCHIALHWDSTTSNKGAFYMSVPNVESYRNMEPVKSNWQKHHALGDSLIAGLKGAGVKIFSSGAMEMDLTQTSFSTVPSIDIELGDKASDHSDATLNTLADGLVAGVKNYFGK
ncbi:MAG: N-acetylmuramoyl-L-alanine amidase [Hungatella hathewayi]|nr:N-acetylmuramoyl-L-alanine amidase [Hungatella hathewayi]